MKLRRSRLSAEQTKRLLEHFVAGTPARTSADLVGVNRNTATYFYHRLREVIAQHLESVSPLAGSSSWKGSESSSGDIEKGGTVSRETGRVAVLGLLVRGGKVYTTLVPDTGRDLLDVLGGRREGVKRSKRMGRSVVQIGGVENFWRQARRNLRRYNGIPAHRCHLFLKECEWRFNYGSPRQRLETLVRWLADKP